MAKREHQFRIIITKGKKRIEAKVPLAGIRRLVFIFNHQFTNAPNTTQISSGAGRSSAAGNNAAIQSPNTRQQQSVGAGGKAKNKSGNGGIPIHRSHAKPRCRSGKEVVVVMNDQIVKLPKGQGNASATQVTSGAGTYSTGGTNSAISSSGTKQQHAVGGGGTAINKWIKKKKKRKLS